MITQPSILGIYVPTDLYLEYVVFKLKSKMT